jgi:hypothetical protein
MIELQLADLMLTEKYGLLFCLTCGDVIIIHDTDGITCSCDTKVRPCIAATGYFAKDLMRKYPCNVSKRKKRR